MKTLSPLLLCLCAVLMASPQIALADDTTTTQTIPPDESSSQKAQLVKEAFAQLDLTPDQKQQIKQIRQTVTEQPQRWQQVIAVLTPEQRQKLRQILQQDRANGGAGGSNTNTSGATAGAGDGSDLAPGAN